MYQQRWTYCSRTDALYPVADKIFSLNSAALRVISGAITLKSNIFLFWSAGLICNVEVITITYFSDWYSPQSLLGCHVFTGREGWTVLFLQMKNKWSWMENCKGMERDRHFCGSMSTTRSHTRNLDTPQWNSFVSMAAHFGAVIVAITEIGLLKCLSDSHWQVLSFVLTLICSCGIVLFFFFFNPRHKIKKKTLPERSRPISPDCKKKSPKKASVLICSIAQYEDRSKT